MATARAGMFDIVGIGFRLISHRAEIMALWNKIAPMIQEAARTIPEVRELVQKIIPGLAVDEPAPLAPADTTQPDYSMKWLQESLNTLDNAGLDVDGEYGPATNAAVHKYQEAHGIKSDGWAGPETMASIIEELAKLPATD